MQNGPIDKMYENMSLQNRISTWNKLFKRLNTLDLDDASDDIRVELAAVEQTTPESDRRDLRKARDMIVGVNVAIEHDLTLAESVVEKILLRVATLLGVCALLDQTETITTDTPLTDDPVGQFETVLTLFLDQDFHFAPYLAEQYPTQENCNDSSRAGRLGVIRKNGTEALMHVVEDWFVGIMMDLLPVEYNAQILISELTGQAHGVADPVLPCLQKKIAHCRKLEETICSLSCAPDLESMSEPDGFIQRMIVRPRNWDRTAGFLRQFDSWLYADIPREWSPLEDVLTEWHDRGALDMPPDMENYFYHQALATKAKCAMSEKHRLQLFDKLEYVTRKANGEWD